MRQNAASRVEVSLSGHIVSCLATVAPAEDIVGTFSLSSQASPLLRTIGLAELGTSRTRLLPRPYTLPAPFTPYVACGPEASTLVATWTKTCAVMNLPHHLVGHGRSCRREPRNEAKGDDDKQDRNRPCIFWPSLFSIKLTTHPCSHMRIQRRE